MADEKRRRKKKGPLDPGEPGTETAGDTSLVNANESDPDFFKDPLIGKTIGKCKIAKLLGEGRTAVVYRAVYAPLKRTVALKVLQPEMTKYPAVVRVFQQEGRAVAALDHENVVKIYDVGEDQGHHYLVLELLRGENLLRRIDATDGGLPVDEALEYVRQTAAGLAAAHRKNLIHRDIKPQNLVIEPDGIVKIVDFGLAAEAEGAFAGGRLGTPHYMAPEVCRGEKALPASDVYALGITLFHMLVGHPPYQGKPTTEEIIQEHLKGERLQPENLRTDLPKPVCDLIRRMTRADAGGRPSAKDIVDFITSRLTPEKLSGARSRRRVRRARSRRRQESSSAPVFAAIGGVVLLLIVAFLVLGGDKDEPKPENVPEPVAEEPPAQPSKPKETEHRPVEDKSLEQTLKELLADAKREERTGNWIEAHTLYQRVVVKAPPDSQYYAEAKAAAEIIARRLKRERGRPGEGPRYISPRASEKVGKEFDEDVPGILDLLKTFDVAAAKERVEGFRKRTREATPERARMEALLERVGIIESLLSVAQTRASSLSGDKSSWFTYDPQTLDDLTITGASEEGIEVRDEANGTTRTLMWQNIAAPTRVAFLEAVRNPRNATETMWLGYYCKLIGSDAAERYFNYALVIDSGPGMRKQVEALKGE